MELMRKDLEGRQEALRKKLSEFLHPEMSSSDKVFIRSNGYYHEVELNKQKDFSFDPGQILMDQHGDLSPRLRQIPE